MGIIGLIFIFFIACIAAATSPAENGGDSSNHAPHRYDYRRQNTKTNRTKSSARFDPSDSIYDEDGHEHEIDDDGYCEECDDYHD